MVTGGGGGGGGGGHPVSGDILPLRLLYFVIIYLK